MRTRVKICGITRVEDAIAAARAGADAIGLVFWSGTPRCVTLAQARTITDALPPFVSAVGLFVDPRPEEVRAALTSVRLRASSSRQETPDVCRSFGLPLYQGDQRGAGVDLLQYAALYPDARAVVFDAHRPGGMPGGTGTTFEWSALPRTLPQPMIVSGGLDAGNVAAVQSFVHGQSTSRAASSCATSRVARARASRIRRASPRSSGRCAMQMQAELRPSDARGHFSPYGGTCFVAETLIQTLDDCATTTTAPVSIPSLSRSSSTSSSTTWAVPAPSIMRAAGRAHPGGAQIYLKREDLCHTGAHKINNCLGQALLAAAWASRA